MTFRVALDPEERCRRRKKREQRAYLIGCALLLLWGLILYLTSR